MMIGGSSHHSKKSWKTAPPSLMMKKDQDNNDDSSVSSSSFHSANFVEEDKQEDDTKKKPAKSKLPEAPGEGGRRKARGISPGARRASMPSQHHRAAAAAGRRRASSSCLLPSPTRLSTSAKELQREMEEDSSMGFTAREEEDHSDQQEQPTTAMKKIDEEGRGMVMTKRTDDSCKRKGGGEFESLGEILQRDTQQTDLNEEDESGLDDETGYEDSCMDDNSDVIANNNGDGQPAKQNFLNSITPSPGVSMLLGLGFTLLVVIPFTFAVISTENNTKAAWEELERQQAEAAEAAAAQNNSSSISNSSNFTTMAPTTRIPTYNGTTTYVDTTSISEEEDTIPQTPTNAVETLSTTMSPSAAAPGTMPSSAVDTDARSMDAMLQAILPATTLSEAQNQSSPQYQAYQWILQDPYGDQYDEWRLEQRMALASFYYAFNGDEWDREHPEATYWLNYNVEECQWMMPSIDACYVDGTYQQISMDGVPGFRGSMPPEIALLSDLEVLEFAHLNVPVLNFMVSEMQQMSALQSFTCRNCGVGRVPSEISEYLPYLEALDLTNSLLTGTIPTELGMLSLLTNLQLRNNQLQGTIPLELDQLTSLTSLSLAGNELRQQVPVSLWSSLTRLKELDFSGNKITGTLPSEIGLTSELELLDFKGGNKLTGLLPSELGLLTLLTAIKLGGNRIGGTLPEEMQFLTNMETLGMTNNQFTGTIPWATVLAPWSDTLSQISLGRNNFTGILPPDDLLLLSSNHTQLHTLDVSENLLDGDIPSELGTLTTLTSLLLGGNFFESTLPSELALLTDLQVFHVDDNYALEQEVPWEMCQVESFNFSNFRFGWCDGYEECCG